MSLIEVAVAVGLPFELPGSQEAVLPFPPFVFAIISAVVFIFLAFVVWSFRDVANRHCHKTTGSRGHAAAGHATAEHD